MQRTKSASATVAAAFAADRQRYAGAAAGEVTVGAAMAFVLLGLTARGPLPSAGTAPLVEAFASDGFVNEWHIVVSMEGLVRIAALRPDDRDRSYKLTPTALAALRSVLIQERAGDIRGEIGVPVVEGPMHLVRMNTAGKITRFVLFSTPRNRARSALKDGDTLGRAVRICEHIRRLAPGEGAGLASCVDEY